MSEAKGKITVIAHVACNNTADSPSSWPPMPRACGVDAIASIPPDLLPPARRTPSPTTGTP